MNYNTPQNYFNKLNGFNNFNNPQFNSYSNMNYNLPNNNTS